MRKMLAVLGGVAILAPTVLGCAPVDPPSSSVDPPVFDESLSFQVNDFAITAYPDTYEIYDIVAGDYIDVDEFARRLLEGAPDPDPLDGVGVASASLSDMSWDFFGLFFVYFRGPDPLPHPLNPCVSDPVTHVHLIIKRASSTPDYLAWSKLHIGTYRNAYGQRCDVVFDSQHTWICLRQCYPTRNDIERQISSALDGASRAAGVVVPATVIATAAYVLSYAVYGALVSLAAI